MCSEVGQSCCLDFLVRWASKLCSTAEKDHWLGFLFGQGQRLLSNQAGQCAGSVAGWGCRLGSKAGWYIVLAS